jgi:Fe-S cluster assembly iron-binding protein IscA
LRWHYGLDMTEREENGVVLVEADGLRIHIERAILQGLSQATLDYGDGLLTINGPERPVYTVL